MCDCRDCEEERIVKRRSNECIKCEKPRCHKERRHHKEERCCQQERSCKEERSCKYKDNCQDKNEKIIIITIS